MKFAARKVREMDMYGEDLEEMEKSKRSWTGDMAKEEFIANYESRHL